MASFGQDNEQGVDLLKAPTSPTSQLLNIAPNTIERPSDLSSFWLSVNSVTNNLTKLPTSYAFDIAPSALFRKGAITLADLRSNNLKDILWQSLILSAGFKSEEDTLSRKDIYKAGIGFKVSFIRAPWTTETNNKYEVLKKLQEKLTDLTEDISEGIEDQEPLKSKLKERDSIRRGSGMNSDAFKKANAAYNILREQVLIVALASNSSAAAIKEQLKQTAREFKINRRGWYLDLAGGFSALIHTN
jgi:hypothetical protein